MYIVKMIPIPGKKAGTVGSVEVKIGDKVQKEQLLFTIETAKGKKSIKSDIAGVVKNIRVEVGQEVPANIEMMDIEVDEIQENAQESSAEKESEQKQYEIVVIGGGPGGYVAALYAAMNGKKVVVIEKDNLGGTCLNVGCIPTKAFVESANLYERMKHLDEFGLSAQNIEFDFKRILDRKNKIVETLTGGVASLLQARDIDVLYGNASFVDNNTISVDGDKNYIVKYDDVIIATGSKHPNIPIKGIDLDVVMNSTDALNLEKLPKSVTIIGSGVIGMEFAFIFKQFGVDVHIIECESCVLSILDSDISDMIKQIALQKGMTLSLTSRVDEIRQTDNNMAVTSYTTEGQTHCVASEKVLVAIGRAPNTDKLGVENTDLKLERGAVVVDAHMKTSVEHIYAIGDVTNIIQLAHVASHQGIVAVDNILGKNHEMDYNVVPSVIFTHPEIATVGVSKIDESIHEVSRFDFSGNGKALVMNETNGFIKLIKDKESGCIVGGMIIGPDASTMINTITLAIKQNMSEKELTSMIFPHPTTGEAIHEAAMGLDLGTLHQ